MFNACICLVFMFFRHAENLDGKAFQECYILLIKVFLFKKVVIKIIHLTDTHRRPKSENGTTDDSVFRQNTPVSAVKTVISVITHHKIRFFRDYYVTVHFFVITRWNISVENIWFVNMFSVNKQFVLFCFLILFYLQVVTWDTYDSFYVCQIFAEKSCVS